jgi:rod shape determining protein RodA
VTALAASRPRTTRVENALGRVPRVDWVLTATTAALLALGALLVWSASHGEPVAGAADPYLKRHLVNIAIGVVLAVLVTATDHRWVRILAPLVYVGSVAGLALVLVMGTTVNGSRSWIEVGGMSAQPSELAKLAVVVGMALVAAERTEGRRRDVRHLDVVGMLAVAAVPATLILLQPDLGTLLVLAATVVGVVAVSGAPRRWLLGLAAGAVVVTAVAVRAHLLKTYQLDRFMAFTNPDLDPRGAGYNTTQARIAIGNGGVFGRGLFEGSQTRSGFVPEQHTDFIFTVAGEELGLVGGGLLILLLGVLLWRALRIAARTEDLFGRLAAAGIACWFGFQAFQNIGMCVGIMPVTGVPLPLVSYGGTSMFATLMAVGLLQNVHLRTARSSLGVARSRLVRSRY